MTGGKKCAIMLLLALGQIIVCEERYEYERDRGNPAAFAPGPQQYYAIYGCYVNDAHQIVSESRLSTGMMPENEGEKYFAILRRCLSGTQGKNLIDLTFQTSQVRREPSISC